MANDIIRIRRDNTTNWTNENPTLALGEIGYDTVLKKLKVGNNTDTWTALDYVTAGITNGTYGDIVVSGGGSTWNLSSALMSTINGKLNSGPLDGGTPTTPIQVMQLRRGTAWSGVILNAGEIGYDTSANEIRVGDGVTTWSGLNPIGLPKISSFTLNDLGDVTITSPSVGQVVTWNGSAFVNQSLPSPSLGINDLTDVVISSPTNTQVLQYNGSNWVNTSLAIGPVSNGDKGDITVSGGGSTWTIKNSTITYAKMQNVSANKILGSAAGGVVSEIDCTSAGRALLDDATAADQRTTLGAAAAVHSHAIADVTGLQTALDGKSATGHTHTLSNITDAGTMAAQNASSIAVTGGTMQDVTVTTGTYSSLANEAVLIPVRKASAGTITKGRPVYIVGSTGTNVTVELAQANAEATSAYTFGVAATDITTTGGFIIKSGLLTGLNNLPTATFVDGDPIYLDETTAGGLRKTLPAAPNHGVFLGFVVKANNGSAGIMDVHIQNYQELEELSDVNISGIAADHFLKRNATNTRWENVSPANARTGLGLGSMATLGSTASGDLSGTWPTLTTQKVQGNTFDAGTPADGDIWQYQTGASRWVHTPFIDLLSYNDIAWDGTTFGVETISPTSIVFPSFGESITNPVNGRIDFTPAPTASTAWKIYFDMTSFNVGVRLGVIRTSDNAVNPTGSYIVFDTTAQIATDKSLSIHSNDWMQLRGTSQGNDTAQLSVLVNNAGSSGAFALVDLGSLGTANRSPTVNHIDPHFYVYSADTNEANDFVRMSHDRTDALIESGNGKLRLKGASVVRIEGPSGGFDLPATAGSNGQVLTTNGTNASWQTPAGGGGSVTEDFVIAMAIAL